VLIDGRSVRSCRAAAATVIGKKIRTIEALSENGNLHPVQQAFLDEEAFQCGYCTPGMIMSAVALLKKNPDPTEMEVRKALSGNLCRCTGYVNVVKSVLAAVEKMRR
jgi:carbon-monoxide dehydrogenase small subunit